MAQVKLALDKLTVDQKIQLATDIHTAMSSSGLFVTPNPTMSELQSKISILQDAVGQKASADQAAKLATIAQRNAELALDAALTTEAAYVQTTTGGDEANILTSGMQVKGSSSRIGTLPAPSGVSASTGDLSGEVDLHWNVVHGANSYAIRQTADPLTSASVWTVLPSSTKSKATVPGLTPGTRYWFEVAGVGAAGQGPWSDPATKMAQG